MKNNDSVQAGRGELHAYRTRRSSDVAPPSILHMWDGSRNFAPDPTDCGDAESELASITFCNFAPTKLNITKTQSTTRWMEPSKS